jgi:predicted nucleic acid-binding protein
MYLFDQGASDVRTLAATNEQIVCSDIGKIEVSSVIHRKFREGALNVVEHQAVCAQLEQDIRSGFWTWLPVTATILEEVRIAFRRLPVSVFLRAADALHLTSVRAAGLQRIYSNDRHLLAAAAHFGLTGVDIIRSS